MPEHDPLTDRLEARRRALSRWENEGGSGASTHGAGDIAIPDLTNAELVQLRVRVIALESVMIAVLAEGSERQLQVARDMAGYIAPRPGFTPHPLTVQAASHIADLVDRVAHFRAE